MKRYNCLFIGLKNCPYSEQLNQFIQTWSHVKRKYVWIPSREHKSFITCRQIFQHSTFPICIAIPCKDWSQIQPKLFLEKPFVPSSQCVVLGG